MSKYDKTIIAPIVAIIALILGSVFHIVLTEDTQTVIIESIGTAITAIVTLYGIFKNHKKPT